MSETDETRFLVQNDSCKFKCRLNENACNSKQNWNHDEYRCWSSCKDD